MSAPRSSLYDREQRSAAYPTGTQWHFWNRARGRIVLDRAPRLRGDELALDLGCGPGAIVAFLRRRGVACIGCDLAHYAPCDAAVAPHLLYGRDAFALPATVRDRVRLLLLLDVLEHLDDPRAFLARCLGAFPGLRDVLITLPARQELWSNFDVFYQHRRRYDRRAVRELCAVEGLALTSTGYFFHALYPVAAAAVWLRGQRGVAVAPIERRRIHGALGWLFYLEQKVVPSGVPGTSIYALARVTR